MSTLILNDSHRWRFKPPQAIGLDRRSSLSRGLIGAALPRTIGNSPDVLGNVWTNVGPLTAYAGQQGYATAGDGATSYLYCAALQLPAAPITILTIQYPTNVQYNLAFAPGGSQAAGAYMRGRIDGATIHCNMGSAAFDFTTPASNYYNLWHRYAFRGGPTQCTIFLDGDAVTTAANAIGTLPAAGVRIGSENLGGGQYFGQNRCESLFIYNRELRDAEILAWTANPYSMFRAPVDRVNPYPPASAANGLISQRASRANRSYMYV